MRSIFRQYINAPALIAVITCLVYSLIVISLYNSPLSLATLGSTFAPDTLDSETLTEEGYDGQFVYYIARYGWESEPYLDVPAYRMQRILLPAIGQLIAFNQVDILPYSLLFINLMAIGIGTGVLAYELKRLNINIGYALSYGLSLAILGSGRLLATEPLAYGLALAGITLFLRQHNGWAALCFALAALTKETSLIFPAAIAFWYLWRREWDKGFFIGIMSLLPFILWQVVLWMQLGEIGVGSGGNGATGFEIIPFAGFFRILSEGSIQLFILMAPIVFGFTIFPALWGLLACWRDFVYTGQVASGSMPTSDRQGVTIFTFLLAFNALLMLFVPFSTYREILGIGRFIAGLQIAIILYAAHKRNKRALMYTTFWVALSAFVIFGDITTLNL